MCSGQLLNSTITFACGAYQQSPLTFVSEQPRCRHNFVRPCVLFLFGVCVNVSDVLTRVSLKQWVTPSVCICNATLTPAVSAFAGGTTITIGSATPTSEHLCYYNVNATVLFGNQRAEVRSQTATQIVVVTPAYAGSFSATVTVSSSDLGRIVLPYTYAPRTFVCHYVYRSFSFFPHFACAEGRSLTVSVRCDLFLSQRRLRLSVTSSRRLAALWRRSCHGDRSESDHSSVARSFVAMRRLKC